MWVNKRRGILKLFLLILSVAVCVALSLSLTRSTCNNIKCFVCKLRNMNLTENWKTHSSVSDSTYWCWKASSSNCSYFLLLLFRNEVKERFENYWNDEKIRLKRSNKNSVFKLSINIPVTNSIQFKFGFNFSFWTMHFIVRSRVSQLSIDYRVEIPSITSSNLRFRKLHVNRTNYSFDIVGVYRLLTFIVQLDWLVLGNFANLSHKCMIFRNLWKISEYASSLVYKY
jgi:hypothetical protein